MLAYPSVAFLHSCQLKKWIASVNHAYLTRTSAVIIKN